MKTILKEIKHLIYYLIKQSQWKFQNKHNFTTLNYNSSYEISQVKVGNGTYGKINFETFHDKKAHLIIGNFCCIAPNVKFLLAGEHNYKQISTYPFNFKYRHKACETFSKGDIIIGDDVWIGYGAIILSGVTIGQGAVIGAGSVVRKDVPPYAIFSGDKVKKFRFENDIIYKLKQFDYSSLDLDTIETEISALYTDASDFCNSNFYLERLKANGNKRKI